MAVANTLAYYVTVTITAVKSFIVQAPRELFTWYRDIQDNDNQHNGTQHNSK